MDDGSKKRGVGLAGIKHEGWNAFGRARGRYPIRSAQETGYMA